MDLNELRKEIESITLEIKNKSTKDPTILVESIETIVKLMIDIRSADIKQNADLSRINDEVQGTIRKLRNKLNQI